MLQVAVAVIERDGRILIGQRPAHKSHPLEWEFPGGKVEAGESPCEALLRELREELKIEAQIGCEIMRSRHRYGGKDPLELIFFEVVGFQGDPVNQVFADLRWIKRSEFASYRFLEGDRAFIRSLTAGL